MPTLVIEPFYIMIDRSKSSADGDWDEIPMPCQITDPALEGFGLYELMLDGTENHIRDIENVPSYLDYLDWLRGEGPVNMYGASPYLVEEFELSPDEADAVLIFWMSTYSDRHPGKSAQGQITNQDALRLMVLAYGAAQELQKAGVA